MATFLTPGTVLEIEEGESKKHREKIRMAQTAYQVKFCDVMWSASNTVDQIKTALQKGTWGAEICMWPH